MKSFFLTIPAIMAVTQKDCDEYTSNFNYSKECRDNGCLWSGKPGIILWSAGKCSLPGSSVVEEKVTKLKKLEQLDDLDDLKLPPKLGALKMDSNAVSMGFSGLVALFFMVIV